jgi:hypothetical protein
LPADGRAARRQRRPFGSARPLHPQFHRQRGRILYP